MARTVKVKSGGKVLKAKIRGAAEVIADNKNGAPPQYHEGFDHLVSQFVLIGATNNELAALLGVSPSSVDMWQKTYASFSSSINQARRNADEQVIQALNHRARGYSHKAEKIFCTKDGDIVRANYTEQYPPDTAASFIWLKNRSGWRDQPEATGPTADDAKRILREEMAELEESIDKP